MKYSYPQTLQELDNIKNDYSSIFGEVSGEYWIQPYNIVEAISELNDYYKSKSVEKLLSEDEKPKSKNKVFFIEGERYSTASYITKNYNISTHRLKLWRESKGASKYIGLRQIKVEGISRNFLYNLNDIEKNIELTKLYNKTF